MRESGKALLCWKMPFKELTEGLNDAQREAVTHGEGPALVLAGPGSGKTTVIVKRILYLIWVRQIPPEEILVVTFTKDAALSMQQRFVRLAQKNYPVSFGTFHSVFYHILLESDHFKGIPTIFSAAQKLNIMTAIMKEQMSPTGARTDYDQGALKEDALSLLGAIGYYKNTQDVKTAVRNLPDRWKNLFEELFVEYQRQCKVKKGLDFDDMVYECRELLSGNMDKRIYWQKRFQYILIDEFQDINPLQYEVIKLLGERHRNLFAVGDDDQSIYGFRGSRPACLRQFLEELNARQIILNANYRSTAGIVASAEKVIAENKDRFPKQCYAAGAHKEILCRDSVEIHSFVSRTEEYAYLVRELGEFIKNRPEETCGVLFRTNSNMQFLASMLVREGIPFQMKERTGNIYEHFIAKDIMAYLKLAAGERGRALFLQVMNRPMRFLDRESMGDSGQVDFVDLKRWYEVRHRPEGAQIQKMETQLMVLKRMSPGLAVSYVCKAMGYERYLRERRDAGEHLEEWLDILEYLRADAREYDTAEEWERGQKSGKGKQLQESPIHLMTVHASKGLEFDFVRIPDCNEKVYPHKSLPDKEEVEEERRVFYVGMTRAKKHLELLCTTGTKERPRVLSRFLNPLMESVSK